MDIKNLQKLDSLWPWYRSMQMPVLWCDNGLNIAFGEDF